MKKKERQVAYERLKQLQIKHEEIDACIKRVKGDGKRRHPVDKGINQ